MLLLVLLRRRRRRLMMMLMYSYVLCALRAPSILAGLWAMRSSGAHPQCAATKINGALDRRRRRATEKRPVSYGPELCGGGGSGNSGDS
jgi:hypothetical protein